MIEQCARAKTLLRHLPRRVVSELIGVRARHAIAQCAVENRQASGGVVAVIRDTIGRIGLRCDIARQIIRARGRERLPGIPPLIDEEILAIAGDAPHCVIAVHVVVGIDQIAVGQRVVRNVVAQPPFAIGREIVVVLSERRAIRITAVAYRRIAIEIVVGVGCRNAACIGHRQHIAVVVVGVGFCAAFRVSGLRQSLERIINEGTDLPALIDPSQIAEYVVSLRGLEVLGIGRFPDVDDAAQGIGFGSALFARLICRRDFVAVVAGRNNCTVRRRNRQDTIDGIIRRCRPFIRGRRGEFRIRAVVAIRI